jgi:hypothetical protein
VLMLELSRSACGAAISVTSSCRSAERDVTSGPRDSLTRILRPVLCALPPRATGNRPAAPHSLG